MRYHQISRTSATPNRRRAVHFIFLFVICTTVIASPNALPQKSRKSPATSAAGTADAKKRAANTKPLTAADHRAAEKRLSELGYWTGKIDGQWDVTSRHALIAFQKVENLKPTGQLTRANFEKLVAANRPSPLETGQAHIEVDLIRQVL